MQCVLSDGLTYITATIEKVALENLEKLTGRKLSNTCLGGLFEIQECEIVATHFGPRPNRITLFVTRLRHLGCDGLAGFGSPRPSHGIEELVRTYERLESYRKRCKGPQGGTSSQSPPMSFRGSQPCPHENTVSSLPSYSTQTSRPIKRKRPKSPESTFEDTKRQLVGRTEPASASPNVNPRNSQSDVVRTSALNRESRPLQPESPRGPPLGNRQSAYSNHEQPIGHADRLLQVLLGNAFDPTVHIGNDLKDDNPPKALVEKPVQQSISEEDQERSQLLDFKGGKIPSSFVKSADINNKHVRQDEQSTVDGEMSENTQRDRRFLISKHDITIPKDQRKLLNNVNAWLPPEPGQRGPIANVPITLLQSWHEQSLFNGRRDQDPAISHIMSHKSSDKSQQSSGDSDHSGSGSPESIDTVEWPASSPHRELYNDSAQLPPDSSAPKSPCIEPAHVSPRPWQEDEQTAADNTQHQSQKIGDRPKSPTPTSIADQIQSPSRELKTIPGYRDPAIDNQSHSDIFRCSTMDSDGQLIKSFNISAESPEWSICPQAPHDPAGLQDSLPKFNVVINSRQPKRAILLDLKTQTQEPSIEGLPDEPDRGQRDYETRDTDVVEEVQGNQSPVVNGFPASQDSDLETMVPTALEDRIPPQSTSSASEPLQSSVPQGRISTLQVKQTPYVNSTGEARTIPNISPTKPLNNQVDLIKFVSPSKSSNVDVWGTQKVSQDPSNVSAEPKQFLERKKASEQHHALGVLHRGEELSQPTFPMGSAQSEMQSIPRPHQPHRQYSLQCGVGFDGVRTPDEGGLAGSQAQETVQSQEIFTFKAESFARPYPISQSIDHDMSSPTSPALSGQWTFDRRGSESVASSPHSAKRRKTFQFPASYNLTQDKQQVDPRVLAKKSRREFFATRKYSLASDTTATTSANTSSTRMVDGSSTAAEDLVGPQTERFSPEIDEIQESREVCSLSTNDLGDYTLEAQGNAPNGWEVAKHTNANILSEALELEQVQDNPAVPDGNPLQSAKLGTLRSKPSAEVLRDLVRTDHNELTSNTRLVEDQVDKHKTSVNAGLSEGAPVSIAEESQDKKVIGTKEDCRSENASDIQASGTAGISIFDENTVQKKQIPDLVAAPEPPTVTQTIYDRFMTAYPDFSGDLDNFVAICTKVNELVKADKMEHRSLWDDFIVRNRIDYRKYMLDCIDKAKNPMPYEKFYRSEIDEPLYKKHIVTPRTLPEALALKGPVTEEASVDDTSSDAQVGAKDSALATQEHRHSETKLAEVRSAYSIPTPPSRPASPMNPRLSAKSSTSVQPQLPKQPSKFKPRKPDSDFRSPSPKRPGHMPSSSAIDLTVEDSEEDGRRARAAGLPSTKQNKKPLAKRLEKRRSKRMGSPQLVPGLASSPLSGIRHAGDKLGSSQSSGYVAKVKDVFGAFSRKGKKFERPADSAGDDAAVNKTAISTASKNTTTITPSNAPKTKSASSKAHIYPKPSIPNLHKDHDSPYNKFLREYFAIRPGNANSYAAESMGKEKESDKGKEPERRKFSSNGARRQIDFLSWKL